MNPDTPPTSSPRIGIDLGGTKIEVIVLSPDGEIVVRDRSDTPRENYDDVIAAIDGLVRKAEEQAGLTRKLPVGIGTPGAISYKTGRMKNCNTTCLNDKPFKEDLAAALGRDVRIANDADCLALSEASDGAAAGARSVFGVILGTGVGGGLCYNGELLIGTNAIAGEWGHNTLPVNAYKPVAAETGIALPKPGLRACYCGRHDCVETWLSGPGFEQSYFEATGEKLPAAEITTRADAGDQTASALIAQYCNLLALALSNVINIVDPDVIVLGGGMSKTKAIYDEVPERLPTYVFSDMVTTRIVHAAHGDSSGVRGSAWLWPGS